MGRAKNRVRTNRDSTLYQALGGFRKIGQILGGVIKIGLRKIIAKYFFLKSPRLCGKYPRMFLLCRRDLPILHGRIWHDIEGSNGIL